MPLGLPDWPELSLYVYLAVGGAVALLLALGLNFTAASRIKAPVFVLAVVGGAGLGIGLATIFMMGFGWRHYAQHYEQIHEGPPPGPPAGGGNAGGGPRGRGGPRAALRHNPRAELASLITKLDLVSHERPTLKLDAGQKQKILEQIAKLDKLDVLLDDEATEAIQGLQKILKEQRKTLEDVGYQWREEGEEDEGSSLQPPNPFKTEPGGEHLKSLRSQLREETK